MNTASNTILGIVEHRGISVVAYVPLEVLTFDCLSYAIGRKEYFLTESLDPDYTTAERKEYADRADFLNKWIDGGCRTDVPMDVDLNLFLRTSHLPAVVTVENIDLYVDALLSVSTIVPNDQMDIPQFALRSTDEVAELWLTDNRSLRNARKFAGPDVEVVETTTENLKALIAIQGSVRSVGTLAGIVA